MSKRKQNRDVKCDVCGRKATKRIRWPARVSVCNRCWPSFERQFRRAGLMIDESPAGSTDATIIGRLMDRMASDHKANTIVTWLAKDKAEYDRACELDLIAGFASWEQYEAETNDRLSAMTRPIYLVSATPDEIIEALRTYGLPNTPEGRTLLWPRLPSVQRGNTKYTS